MTGWGHTVHWPLNHGDRSTEIPRRGAKPAEGSRCTVVPRRTASCMFECEICECLVLLRAAASDACVAGSQQPVSAVIHALDHSVTILLEQLAKRFGCETGSTRLPRRQISSAAPT